MNSFITIQLLKVRACRTFDCFTILSLWIITVTLVSRIHLIQFFWRCNSFEGAVDTIVSNSSDLWYFEATMFNWFLRKKAYPQGPRTECEAKGLKVDKEVYKSEHPGVSWFVGTWRHTKGTIEQVMIRTTNMEVADEEYKRNLKGSGNFLGVCNTFTGSRRGVQEERERELLGSGNFLGAGTSWEFATHSQVADEEYKRKGNGNFLGVFNTVTFWGFLESLRKQDQIEFWLSLNEPRRHSPALWPKMVHNGNKQCQIWMGQMAQALKYVHDRGYAHAQINPDSMLVTGPQRCLLTRFDEAKDVTPKYNTTMELTNGQSYRSPEMADRARPFDAKAADVWAFGYVIFFPLERSANVQECNDWAYGHGEEDQCHWVWWLSKYHHVPCSIQAIGSVNHARCGSTCLVHAQPSNQSTQLVTVWTGSRWGLWKKFPTTWSFHWIVHWKNVRCWASVIIY